MASTRMQTTPDASTQQDDRPEGDSLAPQHEEIAILAYSYWELDGCPDGTHVDHWLKAEKILRGELEQASASPDRFQL